MNNEIKSLIRKKLFTLSRDPRGVVMYKLDNFLQGTQMYIDTSWCRFLAFLWGVQLGSSCKFIGETHFLRYPGSVIKIGKNCMFRSTFRSNMVGLNRPCGISTHHRNAEIHLGENCGLSGTSIGSYNNITIGDHVLIGANTIVTDFDWHPIPAISKEMQSAPVIIDNDVWLGMNCVVLKGVHIGRGTIVGANSVVTKSIPANVIAGGIPTRVLRSLP